MKFAYTLNNTAIATPRLLAAVVENYQTEDQKVAMPQVLQPVPGRPDRACKTRKTGGPCTVGR